MLLKRRAALSAVIKWHVDAEAGTVKAASQRLGTGAPAGPEGPQTMTQGLYYQDHSLVLTAGCAGSPSSA